jgi:hypothetical protein
MLPVSTTASSSLLSNSPDRLQSLLEEVDASTRALALAPVTIQRNGQVVYPAGYFENPTIVANLDTIARIWRELEGEFSASPASSVSGLKLNEALQPHLIKCPFTQLCIDPKIAAGHPALVRMLVANRLTFSEGIKYSGLTSGKGALELLDPMGALLQHFHVNTPAAIAHRNRLYAVSRILPKLVEDLPAEKGNALVYGVGDCAEFAHINLDSILQINLCTPNKDLVTASTAYLENSSGICNPQSQIIDPIKFIGGKGEVLSEAMGVTLCLGMIDYVPRKVGKDRAADVISWLLKNTVEGGSTVVSFITDKNPHKCFLNQALNWNLVHRSREEVIKICESLGLSPQTTSVQASATYRIISVPPDGVNILVVIRK